MIKDHLECQVLAGVDFDEETDEINVSARENQLSILVGVD